MTTRLGPAAQISVVRKEDKEARLTAFIDQDLAARRAGGGTTSSYLLIARSLDSPVARALLAARPRAAALGIDYRVLLMLDDCGGRDRQTFAGEYVAGIDARFGADMRLLDAHEFLVMGPSTVWIGDCMRRDPAKRDAYEFYSDQAPEAAHSAERSFERLWLSATPVVLRRLPNEVPLGAAIIAEPAPANMSSTVEAGTRH